MSVVYARIIDAMDLIDNYPVTDIDKFRKVYDLLPYPNYSFESILEGGSANLQKKFTSLCKEVTKVYHKDFRAIRQAKMGEFGTCFVVQDGILHSLQDELKRLRIKNGSTPKYLPDEPDNTITYSEEDCGYLFCDISRKLGELNKNTTKDDIVALSLQIIGLGSRVYRGDYRYRLISFMRQSIKWKSPAQNVGLCTHYSIANNLPPLSIY